MTRPNDTKDRGFAKNASEIEGDIEHTRSEISEGLSAIGEKFSAENVKHETRELVDDAKEAVGEKLREVKANALESVNETLHDVGASARRAGEATYGYARTNAIPLAMIGLGIGLLTMSSRRQRRIAESGFRPGRETPRAYGVDPTLERAKDLSSRANRRVEEGVEYARTRAREVGHRAREQFVQAEHTAVDFGRENPLAIGAVALAAGIGVGLLLPSTQREDELFGATRDRVVGEVSGSVEESRANGESHCSRRGRRFPRVTRG